MDSLFLHWLEPDLLNAYLQISIQDQHLMQQQK